VDNAETWTPSNTGIETRTVYALLQNGSTLFAGTFLNSVYVSTDNGANWARRSEGLPATTVRSFVVVDSLVFAGTGNGVYVSSDAGLHWTEANAGLTTQDTRCLAYCGLTLLAGTGGGGTFTSTNRGTTWTVAKSGLGSDWVNSLAVVGSHVFAGTSGYKAVYRTTDNGSAWTEVGTNMDWYTQVLALAANSTYLYAGTDGRAAWRRPLSEILTAIPPSSVNIPDVFGLEQNYPNPFNPSTTIGYGLPNRSQVTLTVFNTLGQQVAILQSGEKEAGYHEVRFDANGLSSGVYFYRLRAGDFVKTRRLMLTK